MKRVTAVMDDESGELMEMMKKVPLKRLGESELERLVHGHVRRWQQLSINICCGPAPHLSSKPAGCHGCCQSTGHMHNDGRTDTQTFYNAYHILCGLHNNKQIQILHNGY